MKYDTLPKWRCRMVMGFIAGYNDKVEAHRDIVEGGKSVSEMDGMPRGTTTSDETADKAAKAERLYDDIRLIESSLKVVPPELRSGVWYSVVPDDTGRRRPFPHNAHRNTYGKWRRVFIYRVHEGLEARGDY